MVIICFLLHHLMIWSNRLYNTRLCLSLVEIKMFSSHDTIYRKNYIFTFWPSYAFLWVLSGLLPPGTQFDLFRGTAAMKQDVDDMYPTALSHTIKVFYPYLRHCFSYVFMEMRCEQHRRSQIKQKCRIIGFPVALCWKIFLRLLRSNSVYGTEWSKFAFII